MDALSSILGGEVSIDLHLQFLIRSNHTDMLILKNTKDAIRVSICHTATVIANAFMHSGTTSDQFLRYVFILKTRFLDLEILASLIFYNNF